MRWLVPGFILMAIASPALAGIEQVSTLQCSGPTGAFAITFDHSGRQAFVTNGITTQTLRYEPQGTFLMWRLLDADNRHLYVLRQGDALNGDFGWYFEVPDIKSSKTGVTKPGGTCRRAE